MIGSIALNWALALIISTRNNPIQRKFWLVSAIALNVGIICLFKYESFFALNINKVLGEGFIQDLGLSLPIGISFFTLQAISYIIDVYRRETIAQRNPLYLGMYISMFPQLVAGPIVRYEDIEKEINHRTVNIKKFAQGLRLFTIGLAKKCLLANTCAILASDLLSQQANEIGFIGCLSGAIAYTFQIYFDFSGYSDMAIGLGRMMGFDYPRNFNYPYISKSVTEFWHRWHMTLGSFFKDYVYIPLGGSRVSKPRWMLNIMIVWGLTGIWHGAAWNFLLWGLYYGIILMLEKLVILKALKKAPSFIQHFYCMVIVIIGWVLFSVSGLSNVGEWISALFGAYGWLGTSTLWDLQSWSYASLLPILIIGSTPIFPWIRKKLQIWVNESIDTHFEAAPEKGNDHVPPCEVVITNQHAKPLRRRIIATINIISDIALFAVFVFSCLSIATGNYNPFIYFQF